MGTEAKTHANQLALTSPWKIGILQLFAVFGEEVCTSWRFLANLRDLAEGVPDYGDAMLRLQQARARRTAVATNHARRLFVGEQITGTSITKEWQPWDVEQAILECKRSGIAITRDRGKRGLRQGKHKQQSARTGTGPQVEQMSVVGDAQQYTSDGSTHTRPSAQQEEPSQRQQESATARNAQRKEAESLMAANSSSRGPGDAGRSVDHADDNWNGPNSNVEQCDLDPSVDQDDSSHRSREHYDEEQNGHHSPEYSPQDDYQDYCIGNDDGDDLSEDGLANGDGDARSVELGRAEARDHVLSRTEVEPYLDDTYAAFPNSDISDHNTDDESTFQLEVALTSTPCPSPSPCISRPPSSHVDPDNEDMNKRPPSPLPDRPQSTPPAPTSDRLLLTDWCRLFSSSPSSPAAASANADTSNTHVAVAVKREHTVYIAASTKSCAEMPASWLLLHLRTDQLSARCYCHQGGQIGDDNALALPVATILRDCAPVTGLSDPDAFETSFHTLPPSSSPTPNDPSTKTDDGPIAVAVTLLHLYLGRSPPDQIPSSQWRRVMKMCSQLMTEGEELEIPSPSRSHELPPRHLLGQQLHALDLLNVADQQIKTELDVFNNAAGKEEELGKWAADTRLVMIDALSKFKEDFGQLRSSIADSQTTQSYERVISTTKDPIAREALRQELQQLQQVRTRRIPHVQRRIAVLTRLRDAIGNDSAEHKHRAAVLRGKAETLRKEVKQQMMKMLETLE